MCKIGIVKLIIVHLVVKREGLYLSIEAYSENVGKTIKQLNPSEGFTVCAASEMVLNIKKVFDFSEANKGKCWNCGQKGHRFYQC